jgi:hypothetical protein
MNTTIALLNQSTVVKVSDAKLIAQAIDKQLKKHACPAWGSVAWGCVFATSTPAGAYSLVILDDADQAGALGYHDQDPNGHPYGRVFAKTVLDNGGDILSSANSVSVTASHEALEMFGDLQAGYWAQNLDGDLVALELCDPIEADAYPVTVGYLPKQVMVSNFALPSYFDTEPETSRFDYLGNLTAPFTMTPGGYMIVMTGGQVSQSFGKNYPEWKKAGKRFPAARTARRSK